MKESRPRSRAQQRKEKQKTKRSTAEQEISPIAAPAKSDRDIAPKPLETKSKNKLKTQQKSPSAVQKEANPPSKAFIKFILVSRDAESVREISFLHYPTIFVMHRISITFSSFHAEIAVAWNPDQLVI